MTTRTNCSSLSIFLTTDTQAHTCRLIQWNSLMLVAGHVYPSYHKICLISFAPFFILIDLFQRFCSSICPW
jgi:hypothetical protein